MSINRGIETGGIPGEKKFNGRSREALQSGLVEVRYAELDRDIPEITHIFNQEHVLPHLAGFAPSTPPEGIDIERFIAKLRRQNLNYGPIITATEGEIKKFYEERENSTSLLVATDKNSMVIGTITVGLPGMGLARGTVEKWAVDEKALGTGAGKTLLEVATTLILTKPRDGGLGLSAADAGVIQQTEGVEKPSIMFLKLGYDARGTLGKNCISWSFEEKKFVLRSVSQFRREANVLFPPLDPSVIEQLKKKR